MSLNLDRARDYENGKTVYLQDMDFSSTLIEAMPEYIQLQKLSSKGWVLRNSVGGDTFLCNKVANYTFMLKKMYFSQNVLDKICTCILGTVCFWHYMCQFIGTKYIENTDWQSFEEKVLDTPKYLKVFKYINNTFKVGFCSCIGYSHLYVNGFYESCSIHKEPLLSIVNYDSRYNIYEKGIDYYLSLVDGI